MTTRVISVSKNAGLNEVIEKLAQNSISSLIVTDKSIPIGIITERDIAAIAVGDNDIASMTAADAMSEHPVTIGENVDIISALELMDRNRIRRLIVTDKHGKLKGLTTQTDILKKLDEEFYKVHTTVDAVMSKDIQSVSPNTTLKMSIEKMSAEKKSCIIVLSGLKAVGILTERDIVKHLYKKTPLDSQVKDVCSKNIAYVSYNALLYDALTIMNERMIRHLVVIDSKNKLRGVVTQTDIVSLLHENITKGIKDQLQRFKESLDLLQTGFIEFELNPDGTILWINKHGALELGVNDPEDIRGTPFVDLLDDKNQWPDFIRKVAGKINVITHAFHLRNRVVEGSFKISPLTASGIFKDVTGRFAESECIRNERNRFENILKTLSEGIVIVDKEGAVKDMNLSALDMFGMTRDEVIGEPYHSRKFVFIDEEGSVFDRYTHPLYRVLNNSISVANAIVGLRRADDSIIWLKISATPVISGQEGIYEIVTVLTDITEHYTLEKRYQRILETAREGHWEVGLDGVITRINKSLSDLLGYKVYELIGKSIYDLVDEGNKKIFIEALEKRKHGVSESYEITLRHKNGSDIYAIISASPQMNSAGRVEGAFAFITDVSAIKITQNMLHAIASFSKNITRALSEEEIYEIFRHYLLTLRNGSKKINAVYLTNIDTAKEYVKESINYSDNKLQTAYKFPGVDKCKTFVYAGSFLINDLSKEYACPLRPQDEQEGSYHCTVINIGGTIAGILHIYSKSTGFFTEGIKEAIDSFISLLTPVINNMRLLELNKKLALIDPLTALYNRRYFETFMEKQLALAERNEQLLSIIMLDLDNFKQFNDGYGHDAGDSALKIASLAISNNIRLSDIGVRYGGEEFLIVLPSTDKTTALDVAERIRTVIEKTSITVSRDMTVFITASSGIATYGIDADSLDLLLAKADNALYEAKRSGKNRTCLA